MATKEATTLVTLKGLNQVYKDIRERIAKLSAVYNVRGSKNWEELMALTSADQNDVYNIVAGGSLTPPDEIPVGSNAACIGPFSSPIDPGDWAEHWAPLGGLVNMATDTSAGILKTGSTIATTDSPSLEEVDVGLKISEESQGYVTIPIGSDTHYGLMSTGAQNFSGAKTFDGDTTFNSYVTLNTTSMISTANSFEVKQLKINDATITSSAGVITFSV